MDKAKLKHRIKEEREKLGLKQSDLSKKLGKSVSNISGYEIGDRLPPVDILSKMSDIFSCSTDYLLGKTDSRNAKIYTRIINGHKVEIEALNEDAANKVFNQIELIIN